MSDRLDLNIPTNVRLTGKSGAGLCTGGVFAFALNGRKFILTAVDAFRGEEDADVFLPATRTNIGQVTNLSKPNKKIAPFWHAIAVVALHDHLIPIVDQESRAHYPVVGAHCEHLIGQKVVKLGSPNIAGTAYTTCGSVGLVNPIDRSEAIYNEVIEVRLDKAAQLRRGDAGALVVTMLRQAVGVSIAAKGNRLFVAPLQPLLEKLRLSLQPPMSMSLAGCFPNPITALNQIDRLALRAEPSLNLGKRPRRPSNRVRRAS